MLKKFFIGALISVMALTAGCSKGSGDTIDVTESDSRTVSYDELGLTYTTPAVWREYESTNVYPTAFTQEDIFSVIDYSYVIGDDYVRYLSGQLSSLDDDLTSICKIVILKAENEDCPNMAFMLSDYKNYEKVASQQGYDYYVLYDYDGNMDYLPDEDRANYDKLVAAVPELIESISVFEFDDTLLAARTEKANKTITFITKTLEGDDINSSVFADYDLTLVNVWGTNAYPDIDEHAVLQEVYKWIKESGLKVNIIMVVADTPSNENEIIALNAKHAANAEFTSIMPDATLAKWLTNNLEGIPTTFMVDNNAQVVSKKMLGAHDAEYYEGFITYTLETLNNPEGETQVTDLENAITIENKDK